MANKQAKQIQRELSGVELFMQSGVGDGERLRAKEREARDAAARREQISRDAYAAMVASMAENERRRDEAIAEAVRTSAKSEEEGATS